MLVGTVVTLALGFLVGPWIRDRSAHLRAPPSSGRCPTGGGLPADGRWPAPSTSPLLPIILVLFLMDFMDTTGTILGLSAKAGFLDREGRLPKDDKSIQVDAVSTCSPPPSGPAPPGNLRGVGGDRHRAGRPDRQDGHRGRAVSSWACSALAHTPFFSGIPVGFLGCVGGRPRAGGGRHKHDLHPQEHRLRRYHTQVVPAF